MKQLLTIILIFAAIVSFGQEMSEKKADILFQDKAYFEAAKMYQSLPKTKSVLQNLADCYYYNSSMEKASRNYEELLNKFGKDSIPNEIYFRYAHALKGIEKYKIADSVMQIYDGKRYNTPTFIDSLDNVVPYEYKVQSMYESTTGDFGVAFYNGKVVFASTRNKKRPIYSWNDKPYLDLYIASVNDEGKLDSIEPFSDDINTDTHESTPTFTKDGKTMYFSRTSEDRVRVGDLKFATVRLYKADFVDGKWTNVEELPFSSEQHNTEHPALSPDGKRLYFASDRFGSVEGSMDLYYVLINDDGTYSMPKSLGSTINTAHREQFPFIDDKGVLYFTSDGHQGFGGLDLYSSRVSDTTFSKPLNLGKTINSSMDDLAYAVESNKELGYFSSNRAGADNLYSFTRSDNMNQYYVEGVVFDSITKAFLPGTQVRLFTGDNELIADTIVGEDAQFKFKTKPNTTYVIKAKKPLYKQFVDSFTTSESEIYHYSVALLKPYEDDPRISNSTIKLENVYFEFDKWDITPRAAKTLDYVYELLVEYPTMEIEINSHTDSRGTNQYNLHLSTNRAKASMDYLISKGIAKDRLTYNGFGENQPLVPCGDNCTEIEHSINRRSEFILTK